MARGHGDARLAEREEVAVVVLLDLELQAARPVGGRRRRGPAQNRGGPRRAARGACSPTSCHPTWSAGAGGNCERLLGRDTPKPAPDTWIAGRPSTVSTLKTPSGSRLNPMGSR